jgi:hypothetical protein
MNAGDLRLMAFRPFGEASAPAEEVEAIIVRVGDVEAIIVRNVLEGESAIAAFGAEETSLGDVVLSEFHRSPLVFENEGHHHGARSRLAGRRNRNDLNGAIGREERELQG